MKWLKALGRSTAVAHTIPLFSRPRVLDVPEDVMEHLNDPNYDLHTVRNANTSPTSTESDKYPLRSTLDISWNSAIHRKGSDIDRESSSDTDHSKPGSPVIDFDDDSPYPEVRAAVANIDNPSIPCNTFRLWFLGLLYSVLLPALNQVLYFRYPTTSVTAIVAQLISLPLGKGLEKILPTKRFRTFGYSWSLNPGPFNIKEHVVITVVANVVVYGAYATDLTATQRFFYGQSPSFSYQVLLVVGNQLFGFCLGGILRRIVVWPSSMIWPGALVSAALFNTLNKNFGKTEHDGTSREKFLCIALACSFVWYWIPGYLWTGLSVFNWVCWIAPNNVIVNQLFGTLNGFGLSFITFDWAVISFIGSPLVTLWWAVANIIASVVIFFWILAPALYYTNTWYSKFMPINTFTIFDNTGLPYDPTAIVNGNGSFDLEKYKAYSPIFLPTGALVAYGLAFAGFASVLVHMFLWYRHDIARQFRRTLKDERDIHSRLMQVYAEVPDWWYATIGVISTTLLFVAIARFPTQLPMWAAIVALVATSIMAIPLAVIQAITNQTVRLNVIFELTAGYMVPGKPVANMIVKAIGNMGAAQAVIFAGNLKLGHYMKIPPRIMFTAQIIAVSINCVIVTVVQEWMFAKIPDMCTPHQKHRFICPNTLAFANASLIWGGVGPHRIFSPGAQFSGLLWFFLVGALAPIPFYFLARRYPLSFWRYINIPVFFAGVSGFPIVNPLTYHAWAITGFLFNYVLRRRKIQWWMRYNYILSAALDGGVAVAGICIFLFLILPKGGDGIQVNWWGNAVWQNTADAMGTPLRLLNPGETFGPSTWS